LQSLKTENLGMPIEYRHIIEDREKFLASDAFLFWGDFIHARSYQIDLKYRNKPQQEIDELLNLSFLSEVEDERLKNAVVYGGTIITNQASDNTDPVYRKLFERFFTNCVTVLFRDPLSLAKVAHFRDKETNLGCDCALLLRDSDLSQLEGFSKQAKRKGIGFFLGRSPARIQTCVFARYLAFRMGIKCTWISWFTVSGKTRFVAKLFGFKLSDKPPLPSEIFK